MVGGTGAVVVKLGEMKGSVGGTTVGDVIGGCVVETLRKHVIMYVKTAV